VLCQARKLLRQMHHHIYDEREYGCQDPQPTPPALNCEDGDDDPIDDDQIVIISPVTDEMKLTLSKKWPFVTWRFTDCKEEDGTDAIRGDTTSRLSGREANELAAELESLFPTHYVDVDLADDPCAHLNNARGE